MKVESDFIGAFIATSPVRVEYTPEGIIIRLTQREEMSLANELLAIIQARQKR